MYLANAVVRLLSAALHWEWGYSLEMRCGAAVLFLIANLPGAVVSSAEENATHHRPKPYE
jgi:hypothetical protein